MQSTLALLIAALAAVEVAGSPAGCSPSYSGSFEITAEKVVAKRSMQSKRTDLILTLAGGILTDALGRTGYIASNYQLQFDNPPQPNALVTSGFSACSNGSLALGDTAVFYQCKSGGFYNLYDRSWAAQCMPIELGIIGGGSGGVSQVSDGQPQATSAGVVSQITDGQPQAASGQPITQITDGQVQVPTAAAISQISDGQVQAPTSTAAPISQISDGQVQAPTSTVAPISQISDGQVQAPTSTVAPISQISDGQVQAPTSAVVPISQISDGQVQAPTGVNSTMVSVVPSSPAASSPQTVPTASANKALPGTAAALVLAGFAAVMYL